MPIFDIVLHDNIVWVASFEIIILFDPKTFEMKGSFEAHPKSMVNSLTVSNGYLWSAGNNGEIRLWNTNPNIINHINSNKNNSNNNNFATLSQTLNAHISKILCLTDIDGLVWSGSFDKTIIIWESISTMPITELEAHEDSVRAIYPVEDKVWSLGFDSKIVIWKRSN